MANKEEQERRKAIKHKLRKQERDQFLRALVMSSDDLRGLVAYLDTELGGQSARCDHTPRLAIAWIKSHGYEPGKVLQGLEQVGGFCDCEIAMNLPRNYLIADLFQ